MMKAENGIKPRKEELAKENLKNLSRVGSIYKITIPAIAISEIINYINKKICDVRKKMECLNWLWNFINEYDIDVLPIVYDVCLFVYQYNNNCVFSVAKEIMRREIPNPDESYGGKSLDGNDALILAQAILDEYDEAVILTIDDRMNRTTTPQDIIEDKKISKKLRIIDDLSEI
jgi:hypothetical protein